MLIDEPRFIRESRDPILMLLGEGKSAERVMEGIYEIGHYGSSSFMSDWDHYPENLGGENDAEGDRWLGPYGVCDDVANLVQVYRYAVNHPTRQFVFTMKKVKRDLNNKGLGGGWRWHKWGEYIGHYTPTTEYLDDEPLIEMVYCFHVFEKLKDIRCQSGMRPR